MVLEKFVSLFKDKKPEQKQAEDIKDQSSFKINFNADKPEIPDVDDKSKVNFRYGLIIPYAYAHLYWDEVQGEIVYGVEEPSLDLKEKEILNTLEQGVQELIDISFINVDDKEILIEYLEKNIKILMKELSIKLPRASYMKIMYNIYRDFIGLNKIEPLMNDQYIEDIECNGKGTPVYIVHRRYGTLRTNIIYDEFQELSSFVEKLSQKAGKYISYANPIMDGRLPSGARVNATYTEDITSKGPTFSIRLFTREAWSATKLMKVGTASPEMLAYLWILVENGCNILVVGGTGSGKTSLINILASFIPPSARIVSIEDTKELRLMHENWLPSVARAGSGGGEDTEGSVTLFDLLKSSFRQRPDYVIVGEIRGKEAFVLFQGMASVRGDEKILLLNHDHPKNICIKNLKGKIKYKALCINPETAQAGILPVEAKIRHDPRSKLLKIRTKSGREVIITEDHSLFTYDKEIIPIRGEDLNVGDSVIIPGKLPSGYADLDYINLLDFLPDIRVFAPEYIKNAVKKIGYANASKICNVKSISDYYSNFKRSKPSSIQASKFIKLMKKSGIDYDIEKIQVRYLKKSKLYSAKFGITKEFLELLGYYLSEGTINDSGKNSSIRFYNKNEDILANMKQCIEKTVDNKIRLRIIDRGFGTATELSFTHKVLFEFIKKYCGKGSMNKKIPDFIFGLSKEKIGWFLTGMYNGDGYFSSRRIGYCSISRELIDGLAKLLLVYGIVGRIMKKTSRKNIDYDLSFYRYNEMNEFLRYVKRLKGKSPVKGNRQVTFDRIKDIYLDKIIDIEEINLKKPEYVYDISVPGAQNFIGGFGGILLHNSGHASMSTMHADDVNTVIKRLETEPINLSPSLVETLDIICLMSFAKVKGQDARKLRAIQEVIKIKQDGESEVNTPFTWDAQRNIFMFKKQSIVFQKIVNKKGISLKEINKEFEDRVKLLYALYSNKIIEFEDVYKIINEYYKNKSAVMKRFNLG